MKVEVTQRHIDNGTRTSFTACPIALALRDKLEVPRHSLNVWVGPSSIQAGRIKYLTDGPIRDFINDFDAGEKVEPQTFELTEI